MDYSGWQCCHASSEPLGRLVCVHWQLQDDERHCVETSVTEVFRSSRAYQDIADIRIMIR
eukprot:5872109-Amphidinium_carterae.1